MFTFEKKISLGNLLEIAVLLTGLLGAYYNFKFSLETIRSDVEAIKQSQTNLVRQDTQHLVDASLKDKLQDISDRLKRIENFWIEERKR